jgi:hypothetical protein
MAGASAGAKPVIEVRFKLNSARTKMNIATPLAVSQTEKRVSVCETASGIPMAPDIRINQCFPLPLTRG